MKNVVTNAAEITVLRPVVYETYKTGGGPVSVGATVVQAPKGLPGVVHRVTDRNWQSILGTPFSKKVGGVKMEGLRHLFDAVRDCNFVNVVRVVGDNAKFPYLCLNTEGEAAAGVDQSYEVTASATNNNLSGSGNAQTFTPTKATIAKVQLWCCKSTTPAAVTATVSIAAMDAGGLVLGETVLGTSTPVAAADLPASGSPEWVDFEFETPVTVTPGSQYRMVFSATGSLAVTVYANGDGTGFSGGDAYTNDGGTWTEHDPAEDYLFRTVTAPRMTAGASAFGTAMAAGDGAAAIFYVADGDASANRKLKITTNDTTERATITVTDLDANGTEYTLETHVVGVNATDVDDMGQSAFIETVLERDSDVLRCDYNDDVTWAEFAADVAVGFTAAVAFAGGSAGDEPDAADWIAAWDLFRNESVACDLMFAAGLLESTAIANCKTIAELRHCTFLFDASPSTKHDTAITWLSGLGIDSRQCKCYHAPFAAGDLWYGGKTVWGVSGEMASAHARGDQNYTGAVPGIHYAAAGEKRAKLQRVGITPLFPDDILDRDALYTARINPIVAGRSGGAVCDDDLALTAQENYARFGWVNRILNYIDHRFLQAAGAAKFEPDGLTYQILHRLTKEIMEDLVTSGALVPPRDETYGTNPYIIEIEQLEIDLWQVTWKVCPTGAARRISGQPWLIK